MLDDNFISQLRNLSTGSCSEYESQILRFQPSHLTSISEEIDLTKDEKPYSVVDSTVFEVSPEQKSAIKAVLQNINNNPVDIYGIILYLFFEMRKREGIYISLFDTLNVKFEDQLVNKDDPTYYHLPSTDYLFDNCPVRVGGYANTLYDTVRGDLLGVFSMSIALIDMSKLEDQSKDDMTSLLKDKYSEIIYNMKKNNGIKEMQNRKGRVILNNNSSLTEADATTGDDVEQGAFFIKSPTMLTDPQKKLYRFITDNFTNPSDVLQVTFVWLKELAKDPDNIDSWKGFTKELGVSLVKILTKFKFLVGK